MDTKVCKDCHEVKPLTDFSRHGAKKTYASYCKPCYSERARQWRLNNPEKAKATYKRRYAEQRQDPERVEKQRVANLLSYHKMMDEIWELLGNACASCGAQHARLLQLDHIHGGGRQHRLRYEGRGGTGYYREIRQFLRDNPIQDTYQLLCPYCHAVKSKQEQIRGRAPKSVVPSKSDTPTP